MRLIVSPAKRMRVDEDGVAPAALPELIDDAQRLVAWLRTLSDDALARIWNANDQIVRTNLERLAHMDLRAHTTPALLAYDGIQYRTMAPSVFTDAQLSYAQEHLRILSALYGVLRPLDAVVPYRLEMGAKAAPPGCKDLYEFWSHRIAACVVAGDDTVVNLASKEYSRCVEAHLPAGTRLVSVVFAERVGERVVTRATHAKMARGEMVRFAADVGAREPADLVSFDRMGYRFDAGRSSSDVYTFVCEGRGGHD